MDTNQEETVDVYEQFFGVYLLCCENPKYSGRTYIGFTVDPNRRLKQHNAGRKAGGAWRTSKVGPWEMVLIIHGFPNQVAALRFEWAWQHPHRSRRLNHVPKKKPTEKKFDFCLRILWNMLQIGPWNRLPLTVRWLNEQYIRTGSETMPAHMSIRTGAVKTKKTSVDLLPQKTDSKNDSKCHLCLKSFVGPALSCVNFNCSATSHPICLAKLCMGTTDYVPIEGKCIQCDVTFLWGDLIIRNNLKLVP